MTASTVTNPVDLTRTDLKWYPLDAAARRLARKVGISEGEFVACRVGEGVVRLERPAELLRAVPSLGTALAVTRNEHVIHAKAGRCDNVSIGPERGMVLNHDIDLRVVLRFIGAMLLPCSTKSAGDKIAGYIQTISRILMEIRGVLLEWS